MKRGELIHWYDELADEYRNGTVFELDGDWFNIDERHDLWFDSKTGKCEIENGIGHYTPAPLIRYCVTPEDIQHAKMGTRPPKTVDEEFEARMGFPNRRKRHAAN